MTAGLFDLHGRRALVTGSSQGIGLALAQGLVEAGASVILNGRDPEKLASAASNVPGAECLAFDVGDHAAVRAAIDGFETAEGPSTSSSTMRAYSTARRSRTSRPRNSSG